MPALPPDLTAASTTPPSATVATDPDHHDDHGPPASAGDVAAAWTVARTTSRFDDPPGTRLRHLAGLATDHTVADAADRTAPLADPAAGEARGAVVTAVADLGDGWWRVTYTIKATRRDQTGVTSTPATLDVHVTPAGLVDAERP